MEASGSSLLTISQRGGVTVATVETTNMLDAITVTDFGEEVVTYALQHPGLRLLLNFEKVEFLTSAALSELIRIHDTIEKSGGKLRLWGVSPDIQRVFQVTKLDELLSVKTDGSLDEAAVELKNANGESQVR